MSQMQKKINFAIAYWKSINAYFTDEKYYRPLIFQGAAFLIAASLASFTPYFANSANNKVGCLVEGSQFNELPESNSSLESGKDSFPCTAIDIAEFSLEFFFWISTALAFLALLFSLVHIPIEAYKETVIYRQIDPGEYANERKTLKEYIEYKNRYGKGYVVSILGISGVGKSVFRSHLVPIGDDQEQEEIDTTSGIEFFLVSSPKGDDYYVVFDSPGGDKKEQFKIVDESNILVIFLDHNFPKTKPNEVEKVNISRSRLAKHEQYLKRLREEIMMINYNKEHRQLEAIIFG